MEKEFEVELNDSRIEDYDEILSVFKNWKEHKREINLNTLLEEGKKIQFDVEIESNHSYYNSFLYINTLYSESESDFKSLTKGCAVVEKLTFIILNEKVIKLDVIIKLLNTTWGKDIKSIIESGIELKLYQHKNIKGHVEQFYFNLIER